MGGIGIKTDSDEVEIEAEVGNNPVSLCTKESAEGGFRPHGGGFLSPCWMSIVINRS